MFRVSSESLQQLRRISRKAELTLHVLASEFSSEDTPKVKPFHEIPGPKSYPFVGTRWQYLPFIGEYDFKRMYWNGVKKFEQYGPLVREEIVPNVNLLWIFDPEMIAQMFRQEGKYPSRRSHLAVEKYRRDRPHIYKSTGLLPSNGEEWSSFRQSVQKPLLKLDTISGYIPKLDEIAAEFVDRVGRGYNHDDFLQELLRVYLEFIGIIAFDQRLNCLDPFVGEDSRPMRLIRAANDVNSSILVTDNGIQMWKLFETPLYRRVKNGLAYLEEVSQEFVNAKVEEMKIPTEKVGDDDRKTLLEDYLTTPNLDTKDVVTMIADMLLAGIDTTAFSTSFLMYHLSTNPDKQEKLFQEVKMLLPSKDTPVTKDVLGRARYVKAAIKESLRLNPVSIGFGRIIQSDIELGGYQIPKGTVAVTQNHVSCRMEEYVPQALSFLPERWLKRQEDARPDLSLHKFLSLPFGHGARACIGRRLADQNMQIFTLRLFREYALEWQGNDPLEWISHLINEPDRPLQFKFKLREE